MVIKRFPEHGDDAKLSLEFLSLMRSVVAKGQRPEAGGKRRGLNIGVCGVRL